MVYGVSKSDLYQGPLLEATKGYKTGGIIPGLVSGIGGALKNQYNLMRGQMNDPNSSRLKRQAHRTSQGSANAKSRRQGAIQIARNGKGTSVKNTTISNGSKRVMRDTVAEERPMIGSELIPSLATNRLPAVSLKLGKRLTGLDPITPFLKNLMQSATASCQYGGRIKSNKENESTNPLNQQGERFVISQCFRHCWGDKNFYSPTVNTANPPVSTDNYPDVTGNTTLGPICYSTSLPPGGALQATVSSPYYPHKHGENNFAMLSRPDLEDMMWNLNKLKLVQNTYAFNDPTTNVGQGIGGYSNPANVPNNPMFLRNVAAYQPNRHYRISAIMANNLNNADTDAIDWKESTYKYTSVFKHGTIKYDFKNTEMTGARIEVIVYKGKQGRTSTDYSGGFDPGNSDNIPAGQPLANLTDAIGTGYVNTVMDKVGTEQMGGRTPDPSDIYTNPMYPLLPELKKTKQSSVRFKEISRTAFSLTSGAQRTLEIVLPGDEYDPANVPTLDVTASGAAGVSGHAILDEHSYTVVISVCGVKMSRNISTVQTAADLPTETIVGEIHCGFDVEYLCTYTEKIGAAKYKDRPTINLFNDAIACDTTVKPNVDADVQCPVTPVTVIPIEHTVRNTNTQILPAAVAGGIQNVVNSGVARNPAPIDL